MAQKIVDKCDRCGREEDRPERGVNGICEVQLYVPEASEPCGYTRDLCGDCRDEIATVINSVMR